MLQLQLQCPETVTECHQVSGCGRLSSCREIKDVFCTDLTRVLRSEPFRFSMKHCSGTGVWPPLVSSGSHLQKKRVSAERSPLAHGTHRVGVIRNAAIR